MSSEVVASGPPPLTRRAADAAIDLIDFMAAAVRGVDAIDVTPEIRKRWRSHLTLCYGTLMPSDRSFYADADKTLAEITASWPRMSAEQQSMCRQNWTRSLDAILQFARPVTGETDATLAPTPPQPSQSLAIRPAAEAPARLSSGGYLGGFMSEILAEQRREEEEAERLGGASLRRQVQLQHQTLNSDTLTNLARMRYETMKVTVGALKY